MIFDVSIEEIFEECLKKNYSPDAIITDLTSEQMDEAKKVALAHENIVVFDITFELLNHMHRIIANSLNLERPDTADLDSKADKIYRQIGMLKTVKGKKLTGIDDELEDLSKKYSDIKNEITSRTKSFDDNRELVRSFVFSYVAGFIYKDIIKMKPELARDDHAFFEKLDFHTSLLSMNRLDFTDDVRKKLITNFEMFGIIDRDRVITVCILNRQNVYEYNDMFPECEYANRMLERRIDMLEGFRGCSIQKLIFTKASDIIYYHNRDAVMLISTVPYDQHTNNLLTFRRTMKGD